ncbi:MAG: class I SAM-dependent methyltransferase [Bacillota bacterium]|nr:class I SAM-dependent methyltransferase [Bacillota bacterium]
MTDIEKYAASLHLAHSYRQPLVKTVLKDLDLPLSAYGLDAGCGIGLYTKMLAEEVGPEGHVVGLDNSQGLLDEAYNLASRRGLQNRITLKQGDVSSIPYGDNTFDWAGSMDCIGCIQADSVFLLKELKRVVKPGGMVFLLIWSSQMLLPGHPSIEAQLNATPSGIAPFNQTMQPERHFMRAGRWFLKAGYRDINTHTYIGNISAPLNQEMRDALTDLFEMRWGGCEQEVSRKTWSYYKRLCNPDSPDFILNLADYHAFYTYTLFQGYAE